MPETAGLLLLTIQENAVCLEIEFQKEEIDWNTRKDELHKLVEEYRGKHDYDCIVPFLGKRTLYSHCGILSKNWV